MPRLNNIKLFLALACILGLAWLVWSNHSYKSKNTVLVERIASAVHVATVLKKENKLVAATGALQVEAVASAATKIQVLQKEHASIKASVADKIKVINASATTASCTDKIDAISAVQLGGVWEVFCKVSPTDPECIKQH